MMRSSVRAIVSVLIFHINARCLLSIFCVESSCLIGLAYNFQNEELGNLTLFLIGTHDNS